MQSEEGLVQARSFRFGVFGETSRSRETLLDIRHEDENDQVGVPRSDRAALFAGPWPRDEVRKEPAAIVAFADRRA